MQDLYRKIRGRAARGLACGGTRVGFVIVLVGHWVRACIPQSPGNQLEDTYDASERNFFMPCMRMCVMDGNIE